MSNIAFIVLPPTADLTETARRLKPVLLRTVSAIDELARVEVSPDFLAAEILVEGLQLYVNVGTWTPEAEDMRRFGHMLPAGSVAGKPLPALRLQRPLGSEKICWLFARIHNALGADLGGVLANEGVSEVWLPDTSKYPTFQSWLAASRAAVSGAPLFKARNGLARLLGRGARKAFSQ